MATRKHGNFGGDWTEEKLDRLAQYLPAYTNIFKGRTYKYAYIDAFAGPGHRARERKQGAPTQDLWSEDLDERGRRFTAGSALVAMRSEPPFQSYIFIEHDASALAKLEETLRSEFPQRISRAKFEATGTTASMRSTPQAICSAGRTEFRSLPLRMKSLRTIVND